MFGPGNTELNDEQSDELDEITKQLDDLLRELESQEENDTDMDED